MDLPKEQIKKAQAINLLHEEGGRVCLRSGVWPWIELSLTALHPLNQLMPVTNSVVPKLDLVSARISEHHQHAWIGVSDKIILLFCGQSPHTFVPLLFRKRF